MTSQRPTRDLSDFFDDLRVCPYNNRHKVAAERYNDHLGWCPDQNDSLTIVDCPLSRLCFEKMLKKDTYDHVLSCVDRFEVRRKIIIRNASTQTDLSEEEREAKTKANYASAVKLSHTENNPMNRLQEFCVLNHFSLPRYTSLSKSGPSHAPIHCVTASVEYRRRSLVKTAEGRTIKDAKHSAAQALLEEMYLIVRNE